MAGCIDSLGKKGIEQGLAGVPVTARRTLGTCDRTAGPAPKRHARVLQLPAWNTQTHKTGQ